MVEVGRDGGARLRFDLGEDADGTTLLTLAGELDVSNADGVEAALAPIIATGPQRLIVDVRELEFADSSAIALLVRWADLVPQVEVRQPLELFRRVIDRMGLAARLQVRP